ncbi:MAG TPA: tetratricopeptide repeat protein [Pyrinomonadaceae bacterium]|nr:tetratricopeptide repeat protein [Pyrinomonadaceae bacterium]
MYLTTIRLILLVSIALVFNAGAQAQDPFFERLAKVNALTKSGNEKIQKKDFDGAIRDFNEAIPEANPMPDNVKSGLYLSRSHAYEGKGDLDKALEDLNKAIKLQPNNVYAYQNRASLHKKRKEPDEALADYSKAIKINSKFAFAYQGRGMLLLSQGKDAEAEADFAKYIELFPEGKATLEKEIEKAKAERAAKP